MFLIVLYERYLREIFIEGRSFMFVKFFLYEKLEIFFEIWNFCFDMNGVKYWIFIGLSILIGFVLDIFMGFNGSIIIVFIVLVIYIL